MSTRWKQMTQVLRPVRLAMSQEDLQQFKSLFDQVQDAFVNIAADTDYKNFLCYKFVAHKIFAQMGRDDLLQYARTLHQL